MDELIVLFNTMDASKEEVEAEDYDESLIHSAAEDLEENIYCVQLDDPRYVEILNLTTRLGKLLTEIGAIG